MRALDPLHLALLIIPVCSWIGYQRKRNRLPWAKRIFLGYALGNELSCCVAIIIALGPSFAPIVATDLVWLALACVPAFACVLAYASYWHWLGGGWR